MGEFSWVTLATNDSYSLGALVLAHSLKRVGTVHQLVVMVTPGVTKPMREKLAIAFDLVSEVNILDSKDERNLLLLQRPELGITFTKLHCWRLTQYKKCVFLDADTLVLQNCDELFDREEFSAAPDVGWPDCFNSGVFVYKPSDETFNSLFAFAVERGSFDGGDQGLLNLYFSDWAHKDISKHLPFIYNMCSTACYSYLPAFKQFGGNVKIVHFIGNSKPWLQYFNSETMQVSCNPGFEHMQSVFEHWWNIFCSNVHSGLQPSMARINKNTTIASSCTSSSHSLAYCINESKCEDSLCTEQFCDTGVRDIPVWDPWENYMPTHNNLENDSTEIFSFDYLDDQPNSGPNYVESTENKVECSLHESSNSSAHSNQIHSIQNLEHVDTEPKFDVYIDTSRKNEPDNVANDPPPIIVFNQMQPSVNNVPSNENVNRTVCCDVNSASTITVTAKSITADSEPATQDNSNEPRPELNGGLAGAFAQMTLREPRSPGQDAFEDHLRRQGWEAGRIDYLGQDSFDNVWKKICETMAVDPRRLSDAEHYSPVVVRASPRRESSAYNITEEAATAIKPPNPATITESAEDDTLDIPTPAPIKASDFAPAVVRASTPVPESVKISQPSGIVSEIPAVVSSPATISETAAVVSPVATVPELAKIASSCANASEAAVVASSPATVSRIDSATPSATDHEPSQVVTVAATTGIALSPASVCEPAAVASSPATVPESCEFAPSATVSKAAVVETSPSTLSDPAATVPSLAAETQASSPVMISESATVASVIDSAVTSVAPTAVSQAVAAESAPTTISIPAEIATVPVSELVSSVPVVQSDSTSAVVKTDSTPAVVKTDSTPAVVKTDPTPAVVKTDSAPEVVETDSTPAVKTDSAPEVVKTDSASAVLSETATLADPTSKSTAKKSETDSVPVVESTATPVVECPAAAVLTPSQIPPEPVSAVPVVEQKSEVAKETSKPDTKAIEKPKPASTTEEQQPEKSTSAAETKKEASKSSEKSSEPTPVPPPRKSGKNGGASSKKTTKKK